MPATNQQTSNHVALVKMDRNLVANILGLPHDTSILQAFVDMATMEVYFMVESPDLPEVPEGHRPPLANPLVTTTFDWGLKDGHRQ